MRYPKGMEDYVRNIAEGKRSDEIARLVAEHFGIAITVCQCRKYMNNHRIKNGMDCRFKIGNIPANKDVPMSAATREKCKATWFKLGNIPTNRMKVGEYTHTTNGYYLQKVKDTGTRQEQFKRVHYAVWEEHNGPIPEGKIVIFLDGNKEHCSIENLMLVDRAEELELNRSRLRTSDSERTKTGVLVAKLRVTARKKKRAMR